jgi:hypothetical protein
MEMTEANLLSSVGKVLFFRDFQWFSIWLHKRKAPAPENTKFRQFSPPSGGKGVGGMGECEDLYPGRFRVFSKDLFHNPHELA